MTARDHADDSSRGAVFRAMFEAHHERVVLYAESQLGYQAAAEDVAAEVFRVAWQKLDPEAPFGLPWLIRTAMNKCRDVERKVSRGHAAATALASRADVSDESGELERLHLMDAMARLPFRDRQLLQLTYWHDLSAGEVAEVLRMRQGAVWTRLHRARAKLRDLLGESVEGGDPDGRPRTGTTTS